MEEMCIEHDRAVSYGSSASSVINLEGEAVLRRR